MDAMRFSTLAHGAHDLCNPLDAATLDLACERLGLAQGDPVIDVGCGKGELLVRLAERRSTRGVGLEMNPAHVADGRRRAEARAVTDRVTFVETDATRYAAEPGSFAAALCIGATHALGGHRETLIALRAWLRPGGRMLIGEGYWRREPAAGYLAVLGATRDDHGTHADNLALGAACGLRPIESWESGVAAWDRYEDLYAETALAYAHAHPDDPDAPAIIERVHRWRDAYRRWGRDTLGFGLYLYER